MITNRDFGSGIVSAASHCPDDNAIPAKGGRGAGPVPSSLH